MNVVRFEYSRLTDDVREYKLISNSRSFSNLDYFITIPLIFFLLYQSIFENSIKFNFGLTVWILVVLSKTLFNIFFCVKEESLLVIRDIGIETKTKYYSGRVKNRFIDKSKITAIIINEGFRFHSVISYMAFIVENKSKMVLAFESFFPKLNVLLKIYNGTRAVIFDEPETVESSLPVPTLNLPPKKTVNGTSHSKQD